MKIIGTVTKIASTQTRSIASLLYCPNAKQLQQNARTKVLEYYAEPVIARRYEDLYKHLKK